jgi:hypothetical protein
MRVFLRVLLKTDFWKLGYVTDAAKYRTSFGYINHIPSLLLFANILLVSWDIQDLTTELWLVTRELSNGA